MVHSRGNLDMYKANPQIAIDQQHNEVLSNIHLVFYELYFPAVSSYRVLIWLTTSYKTCPRTGPRTDPRIGLEPVLELVLELVSELFLKLFLALVGALLGPKVIALRSTPMTSTRSGKISRYSIPSLYAVRQWPTQFPTSI